MKPADRPAADARTPVHILTGFLGSGKTTLLRRLLADPALADTAVIINELGEVGLDQLLVREVTEDVVLLGSGCLCCTVRDDLVSTLAELDGLRRRGEIAPFSRAVVETTGLADPAPIVQALLGEKRLAGAFRLGQVVTTVDGLNFEATLAGHREARQQLDLADRLVLTKCDLLDADRRESLLSRLAALNPHAAVCTSGGDDDAIDALFAPVPMQWRAKPRAVAHGDHGDHGGHGHHAHADVHDGTIGTFVVALPRPVHWDAFVEWIELLLFGRGDSILRVKGLLNVAGDERPVIVQGVQHVLYPPEHLPAWPDPHAREGWIVFIARNLTRSSIETSLRSLLGAGDDTVSAKAAAELVAPT
jgi:G3E family GTPase